VRVHHLNCGSLRPFGGRLISGTGTPFGTAPLVCHCLLVETDRGLVLVDTGFGLPDVAAPAASLGRHFLLFTRPRLAADETAVRQVARLGYDPRDVRHIVLTHLDPDHAGGLRDFLWAKVHVHATELAAANRPASRGEKLRYRPGQWAHGPDWATYPAGDGERWFGFDAVRQLDGLPAEILLLPLPGHTRGHTGVAVQTGDRWLLHAGDAYFFHAETDPVRPRVPPGLALFQTITQVSGERRRQNQARLRELRAAHADKVAIFSAHDPVELARS